jgi:hypothetical protein
MPAKRVVRSEVMLRPDLPGVSWKAVRKSLQHQLIVTFKSDYSWEVGLSECGFSAAFRSDHMMRIPFPRSWRIQQILQKLVRLA